MTFRAVAAAVIVALAAPAGALADDASACPDADVLIDESNVGTGATSILCLINDWRGKGGRGPLARSGQLDVSSLRHTRDMVARHYLAHRRRGGPTVLGRIRATGYFDNAIDGVYSENIGVVPRETGTPRQLVNAWLASPDHRDNIADAAFRDIGVGIAFAPPDFAFYPDDASLIVTTDFGQRSLRPRPKRYARRCQRRRTQPARARPYCRRKQKS